MTKWHSVIASGIVRAPRLSRIAANLGVGELPRRHQLLPGRIRIAPVLLAAQHRLLPRIGIEHVMEREVLDVFSGHLRHARRPAAVAPRDQLNRGIGRTHGLCELDRLARRGFQSEAILVVGGLVADLPVPDVPAAPRAREPSARDCPDRCNTRPIRPLPARRPCAHCP